MASSRALSANKRNGILEKALRKEAAPFLLPDASSVVAIAFSGGMDSTVLLHAAGEAFKGRAQVLALHVDHGIAADSAKWAGHCKQLATELGTAFAGQRLTGLRRGQPNIEEAARNARWNALVAMARRHDALALITAHHAQDQAETVLLNLMRGTGLAGIGMAASSVRDGLPILRPWLHLPRAVLAEFADQHQLRWIEDPSNADPALRRNAVRHQLWPAVLATDERALSSIVRFAELADQAEAVLQWLGQRQLAAMQPAPDMLAWSAFSACPDGVQAVLFRLWLASLHIRAPSQARLQAMLAQLAGEGAYSVRCVHAGWSFAKIRCGSDVLVHALPAPSPG